MSEQHYTELDGHKHLLEVAENILYSSEIDEEILEKYEELKRSIHKKITSPSVNSNNKLIQQQPDTFYINLLSTYRLMIDNVIKIVQSFEEELESDMERGNYNHIVNEVNERFVQKVEELEALVDINSPNMSNTNPNNTHTKTKLLHREEINTIRYEHEQLDSKFENLGLLIEVHKKMHEIILEATRAEEKKSNSEDRLKDRIKELEEKLNEVGDVKMFMEQHRMTEQSYVEFVTASKALKKILFANYEFK